MSHAPTTQPPPDEHIPYYTQYIRLVPDGDILAILARQIGETAAFCASFPLEREHQRPAPGEWDAVEVVGHLADSERVLSYRALRIARADPTPLEGVASFDPYVVAGGFAGRALADAMAAFAAVRGATVALFHHLDTEAWARRGTADGNAISVRALAHLMAGHELHHIESLRLLHVGAGQG